MNELNRHSLVVRAAVFVLTCANVSLLLFEGNVNWH